MPHPSSRSDGPVESLRSPADRESETSEFDLPATLLPKLQLTIIFAILLCESLTTGTINPFIARLVNDVGATHGKQEKTGYYFGLIESTFFLMQGIFMFVWGRISDKLGRRPVLLSGCIGTAISLFAFGLSKTFLRLILSRGLAGVLNGNAAVAKTAMAELTDETNRARTFSFIRVIWITGMTIGPFMGGNLQHPAERLPHFFGSSTFLRNYPYFLPCFAAACCAGMVFFVGAFRLDETHPDKVYAYKLLSSDEEDRDDSLEDLCPRPPAPPLHAVLTPRVLITIMNYALLAIISISYTSLLSLFLAVPISSGGLGLPLSTIGLVLAGVGLTSGCVQVIGFPMVHRRWGAKSIYLAGLSGFLVSFTAFGVMRALATRAGRVTGGVWSVLVVQLMASYVTDMTFSCIFIYVTASAPSPALLGSTNGLAQTIVSFVRALGPAGSASLFSLSLEKNLMGGYFVFVLFFFITVLALCCGTLLPVEETRQPIEI